MPIADHYGRKINYLRLSITDRCNMRCIYCMPTAGAEKIAQRDILSYEDFMRIARAAVSLGIEKIRVTGGEPLERRGVVDFLARLAGLKGLQQLVLTTNGVKLAAMAQALKDAGVQRLNISLDSLRPETFRQLTRRDLLSEVLAGIDAVERIGLPYKINMVVMRGYNDREIADFAALTATHDCTVRFIEYMPILKHADWRALLVPTAEILERLQQEYVLELLERNVTSGPAREFAITGARGRIGVIDPLSGHFCDTCNRIRITAAGKVRTCLFAEREEDLRPYLQPGAEGELARRLRQLIDTKPAGHVADFSAGRPCAFTMARIGG